MLDIEFLLFLQRLRNPFLDALFQFITTLGEETLLIAAICMVYWCMEKRLAQFLMFCFFVSGLMTQLLKISFCVPRPWVRDARLSVVESAQKGATGYSFPSGHTASATAAFGGAALYFRRKRMNKACTAVILLIGFSRLYLGAHAPQDVIVSWVLGAVLLLIVNRCFGALEKRPELDTWVFLSGLTLSLALMLYAQFKPYPQGSTEKLVIDAYRTSGAAMGMFVGWLWERRSIRFEVRAKPVWQMLKYALGMALILSIMLTPWPFSLMNARPAALMRYALLSFTAIGLWPYLFSKYLNRIPREKEES